MITLREFLTNPAYVLYEGNEIKLVMREHVLCADGFTVSIQGSGGHRCEFCEDGDKPFYSLELGYPSELDPLLDKYAEKPGVKRTVFNYVPWEVVEALLEKHGGLIGTVKRQKDKG